MAGPDKSAQYNAEKRKIDDAEEKLDECLEGIEEACEKATDKVQKIITRATLKMKR